MADTSSSESSNNIPAPVNNTGGESSNVRIEGVRRNTSSNPLQRVGEFMQGRGDIMMAMGIIALLVVLILPMPKWLLDVGLAVSFTFSVLVLMTALFIHRPLDFSSFPTVLLIATMMRLALNMASTRLILSDGHTGPNAAGEVIKAFGGFVMQDNFVIGIIIFSILVLVNFVVITKGAGRIAEVSARFSLDAMPGKQMAIDADLSAGLIDETTARSRRKALEDESTFFGSMDGASKFVRGDAIAGLLITFINVIGGLVIGTLQHNLSLGEAASNYTQLTVGDGLVSQIPALIVSTAAGLLVSKSGNVGSAEKAVFQQLGGYPRTLGMTAFLSGSLALLPGIPAIPFLLLAASAGGAAYFIAKRGPLPKMEVGPDGTMVPVPVNDPTLSDPGGDGDQQTPQEEEPISAALQIDHIRLELGYGLLSLINNSKGQRLTDQIRTLRRQIAAEVGFIMPAVRIQDNLQLPANNYVIRIKEIESGRGDLRPNMILVMDPRGEEIPLAGEMTTEPTFGLPAMWVEEAQKEDALFRGYTAVDPPTVITTHLTEVIKDNMSDLLSYTETQKLLDEMNKDYEKLVADIIPSAITVGSLQRTLQNLLSERISIRDLPTILEGVQEATGYTRNVTMITEHVRARMARQISDANTKEQGFIPILTLSPQWEQIFSESLVGDGEDKQLSMAPSRLQEFIASVKQAFDRQAAMGEAPVLLTSPAIRPYVRSIIERFRPSTTIMSQNEVHQKAKIKTLGQI